MGWSIGWDSTWGRDIGYGVPATCDHPECSEQIDRGLAYVCGGEPYGGDDGCGLYFCGRHLLMAVEGKDHPVCERCAEGAQAFAPKPDCDEWVRHQITDASWSEWRDKNPDLVESYRKRLGITV